MRAWFVLPAALFIAVAGCASPKVSPVYQTLPSQLSHQSEAAKKANEKGLLYAQGHELDKAEASFREALQIDVGYAAAHNNLGLVLLSKGKCYEAAMEFRFAGKLNPHAVEPVTNLARLYESVGWKKEAEREYARAAKLMSGDEGARRLVSRAPQNNTTPNSTPSKQGPMQEK